LASARLSSQTSSAARTNKPGITSHSTTFTPFRQRREQSRPQAWLFQRWARGHRGHEEGTQAVHDRAGTASSPKRVFCCVPRRRAGQRHVGRSPQVRSPTVAAPQAVQAVRARKPTVAGAQSPTKPATGQRQERWWGKKRRGPPTTSIVGQESSAQLRCAVWGQSPRQDSIAWCPYVTS
jgi:hypothetical protein